MSITILQKMAGVNMGFAIVTDNQYPHNLGWVRAQSPHWGANIGLSLTFRPADAGERVKEAVPVPQAQGKAVL